MKKTLPDARDASLRVSKRVRDSLGDRRGKAKHGFVHLAFRTTGRLLAEMIGHRPAHPSHQHVRAPRRRRCPENCSARSSLVGCVVRPRQLQEG